MASKSDNEIPARRHPPGEAKMADVARLAGTSIQTVSRVLLRPELVAEKTRENVLNAIKELNYIPNVAARLLVSRVSKMIAVLIPSLSATVYAQKIHHIVKVLESNGFSVLIGNTDYSYEREERLVESFLQRRPDGFILTGNQHSEKTFALLRQSGVPVVETYDGDAEALDVSVGFSNFQAGRAVAELFLSRGLRRLAFAGGQREQDFRANARFEGFRARLAEDGIGVSARIEMDLPMAPGSGIIGLDRVLDQDPLVQGIFFSADSLAIPALLECNRRGIRVPEQLSICGFGDYDYGDLLMPALTTVAIPFAEVGRIAAETIMQRIEGRTDLPSRIDVHFAIKRRGSA